MSDSASGPSPDLAGSIDFAAWHTVIENDDLALGRLYFDLGTPLLTFANGKSLALPLVGTPTQFVFEATFISVEKEAVVRVASNDPIAFRVLDENGLTDLWTASRTQRRSGCTTFRVTGHKWSDESFLVFLGSGDRPRYSYIVATSDLCLELVCVNEPIVDVIGSAVIAHSGKVC